jgi:hypothetical protein
MENINYQTPSNEETKNITKKKLKQAINATFHTNITKASENKSKVQHLLNGRTNWNPGERPTYMSNMNRNETSILFKAQTRMLPIKNNYRTKYKDLVCRGCKAENETQQHVLQMCKEIHKNNNIKVYPTDYFSEDIEVLTKNSPKHTVHPPKD